MILILASFAVIGGLVLLGIGADRLILGACALARRARLPEAVIGATIVAAGTSMPELVASLTAAFKGQYGLAVGNVVGSNSFNIGAILGLVALIAPMAVASVIAKRDWWVMMLVTICCCVAAVTLGAFPVWVCALFTVGFISYAVWSVRSGHGSEEAGEHPVAPMASGLSALWIILGIGLLTAGGWALVWGSIELAKAAGVSDAIIGLTIVAAGTSAPELMTSLLAARRGQHQIAVANIVGSNTFNILFILGVTGLFGSLPVAAEIAHRDVWWMLGFTLILPFIWGRRLIIGRIGGGLLLGGYLIYLGLLIRSALH